MSLFIGITLCQVIKILIIKKTKMEKKINWERLFNFKLLAEDLGHGTSGFLKKVKNEEAFGKNLSFYISEIDEIEKYLNEATQAFVLELRKNSKDKH